MDGNCDDNDNDGDGFVDEKDKFGADYKQKHTAAHVDVPLCVSFALRWIRALRGYVVESDRRARAP